MAVPVSGVACVMCLIQYRAQQGGLASRGLKATSCPFSLSHTVLKEDVLLERMHFRSSAWCWAFVTFPATRGPPAFTHPSVTRRLITNPLECADYGNALLEFDQCL